jgi:hypothetical protein
MGIPYSETLMWLTEDPAVRKLFIKKRYIEIVGEITTWRIDLTLWNVFSIGEFTRENVHDWLADYTCKHYRDYGWFPVDFHAVCGEQDIPWATKEAFECFERYSRRKSGPEELNNRALPGGEDR